LRRTLSATVLLAESSRPDDSEIDVRMILFKRLNTGGVQLNPQELRNAIYDGFFNQMLQNISRTDIFTKIWGIPQKINDEETDPPKELLENAIYKSMADCELVLRFFAIRDTIKRDLKGGLRKLLDNTMRKYYKFNETKVLSMESHYMHCLSELYRIFNKRPFILPEINKPSRNLYDSLIVAYSLLFEDKAEISDPETINNRLKEKLDDTKEYDVLLGRGNSIEAIKNRINLAKKILQK
jgi:hypothetical protein